MWEKQGKAGKIYDQIAAFAAKPKFEQKLN